MLFLHIFLESNSNSNATICVIFNHCANYGLLFKNKTSEEKSKILIISVKLIFSHFHISLCPGPNANESGLKGVCVFGWSWLMLHLLLLSIILFSLMQIAICLETRNHFSFLLVVEKNFYCILMRSTQTKLLLIKLTFSHRLASCKNDGSLWAILVKFFTIKKVTRHH